MRNSKGISLIEALVSIAVLGIFAAIVVPNYFGLYSREYLVDYTKNLELLLQRSIDYAQQRQEPISVCFALSEACNAEGIMIYRNLTANEASIESWKHSINEEQPVTDDLAQWQMIEALPLSKKVSISSNFSQQRLMIRADGLSVFQPGSVFICQLERQAEAIIGQRIIIARTGRLRREAMTQSDIERYCE